MNSCCCENPYVGKGQAPFNPSEVRLYGRKQYCTKEDLKKMVVKFNLTAIRLS